MKKKFLVAAAAATMALGMSLSANAADLSDGLIGEYLFDGNLTDGVSGQSAEAYSAYGDYWAEEGTDHYNLNTHPRPMIATDSTRGNVVEMNGLWQHTGYLKLNTECLKKVEDSFSVAMWTKANNSKTENGACGADSGLFNFYFAEAEKTSFKFCGLDVSLTPWINDGAGDWADRTASGVKISTDKWDFVVMTMDFENEQILVYVNGEQTAVVNALGGGTYASLLEQIKAAKEIQIGTIYPWWDVWDFRGYTDDIRMYNKVLTQDDVNALYALDSDKSVVPDTSDVTTDTKTYAQYKAESNGKYTVRVVSEVAVADTAYATYKNAGFRCAKTASSVGENYLGTKVYSAIKANGVTVPAAEGKCFVVLEITDVTSDAKLYVEPVLEDSDSVDSVGSKVTVDMATLIK